VQAVLCGEGLKGLFVELSAGTARFRLTENLLAAEPAAEIFSPHVAIVAVVSVVSVARIVQRSPTQSRIAAHWQQLLVVVVAQVAREVNVAEGYRGSGGMGRDE